MDTSLALDPAACAPCRPASGNRIAVHETASARVVAAYVCIRDRTLGARNGGKLGGPIDDAIFEPD